MSSSTEANQANVDQYWSDYTSVRISLIPTNPITADLVLRYIEYVLHIDLEKDF